MVDTAVTNDPSQPMMPLAMALRMAEVGYHLAPVTIHRDPVTGKKRPDYHRIAWAQKASTDPSVITTWARRFGPQCGFLVACEPSGIVGVDLDVKGDAITWWAREGLPISTMRVDTPSGGQHHYFRMPDGMAIPNSASAIAPGVDIRGHGGQGGHLFAPGTSIVGENEPYRLADPLLGPADLPVLPDEIVKAIPSGRRKAGERGADSAGSTVLAAAWVIAECTRQLTALREHDRDAGEFRHRIMGAAMVLGRAVAAGLAKREFAERRLRQECTVVWGSVDAQDVEWITCGLDDGEADPWTVIPTPLTEPEVPDALDDPDGHRTALAAEVARLRLREDARAVLAAENRRPLRRMSASEFLAAPQPEYLVPGLLYRDTLAVVFGPPGSAKTFFTLDVALALATGRPWRGQVPVPRCRVHYLMAEGQAVNVGRTLAWLHHHGVPGETLDDWFDAFPEPVTLTEDAVGAYLAEVERDRPALIVLDTKHAMMEGDESKAADVKVMRDALDAIRRVCGSTVLLVDHTGLGDQDRARGSNSQRAMVATEIKLSDEGGIRTAQVLRNTAGKVAGAWSFELREVPGAPHPEDTDVPAVAIPVDPRTSPFAGAVPWNDPSQPPLPDDIAAYSGRGQAAVRPLARFMRHSATGGVGHTMAEARRALWTTYKGDNGKPMHSEDTVTRAWGALVELGRIAVAEGGGSTSRSRWLPRPNDPVSGP